MPGIIGAHEMTTQSLRVSNSRYRNVFLVQNLSYWKSCPFEYDKEKDLVLSFDFAVVTLVLSEGGEAQYIDHIVKSDIMEQYNYKAYEFLASWHYNAARQDIFAYRGIEVGSAFRIEIWNDVTFYVRIFVSLHELIKGITYEAVYSGMGNSMVTDIIRSLGLPAIGWSDDKKINAGAYYFPIFRWMDEALHPTRIRRRIKVFALRVSGALSSRIDRLSNLTTRAAYVFIERYHPTSDIITELKKSRDIRIIRSDFNSFRDLLSGMPLPIFVPERAIHKKRAQEALEKFEKEKYAGLFVDEIDISEELYKIIKKRIAPLIARSFKTADVIINFFSKRKLSLMITIASIGVVNRLMINFCKKNDIPVYMIINGILANSFLDEAKEGTWINSYSDSIRKNYFAGMDNIVCLGDPRMDAFSRCGRKRRGVFRKPTIGIGASGFSNVDLNCFLAIEFEFLNDIMKAVTRLRERGRDMNILLKVRSNGYREQYQRFLKEYYPDMPVSLFDCIPIREIYERSDFFISIYSQSLFEAACLGIPVLYYKNDTQYFHPPFDGKSELVTAFNPEDLERKIDGFYERDPGYEPFLERKVLEKYIGPLDGQNLKRNTDFIYSLIVRSKVPGECHGN